MPPQAAVPEAYAFFGVNFSVQTDDPDFREAYRFTYRRFLDRDRKGSGRGIVFAVHANRNGGSLPQISFADARVSDLAAIFQRGSNRHRFAVTAAAGGWSEIRDAFLGGSLAMTVHGSRCVIHDRPRWQAYCESVIFHTVVSQLPDHFLLHAGVVAKEGRGIVLCGEANKGKTTLVLNLVRRGLDFLSDEVAWIDPTTRKVHAFPRALGVREKTLEMIAQRGQPLEKRLTRSLSGDEKWLVDVADIVPCVVGECCEPRCVVFLDGFSETTRVTPLSAAAALLRMVRFAHTGESGPIASMMMVSDVMKGARFYGLTAGPPEEAAEVVARLVET